MFVVVINVDGSDEKFNGSTVTRVQVALPVSLRPTDVAVVLWSGTTTLSYVDAHRTTGRRQLDDRRRRSHKRLRRQMPLLRPIPVRRRRVRGQPSSEAVQRHSEPLSGKRAEASGTGGREGQRSRAWHGLVVRIVGVGEVVDVWIDIGAGQNEAKCIDRAA